MDKLKNGLNDKIDGNLAEVVKLVNDESERLSTHTGKVEGEMREELAALRSNMNNIEADAAAKARESSEGHEKQLAELKMAVEEEKMLRGQGRYLVQS